MKILRIEGVNLAHSIDDTEDLSTRRGGSLMLLDAINKITHTHAGKLKKISTGASTGLFEIMDGDSAAITSSITKHLAEEPYCHATFVIDVIDSPADFPTAEAAATAANRWRQMQSLSFSPVGLAGSQQGVCTVDEVRPARERMTIKDEEGQLVSASVKARREHGLTAKRKEFYRRTLVELYREMNFPNDFEGIASNPAVTPDPKTLQGKLAVFYADGNRFGHIARECKTPEDLIAWDDYIKEQRKALLAAVLEQAEKKPHWQNRDGNVCLETLLWGGDELMFVVPGWCGLELAELFFNQTKGLSFRSKPLTHAGGLVFCHQQAPISRISKLAKDLADKGKQANRDSNSLNWLVLESFDHAGSDLDRFLAQRFKQNPNPEVKPKPTWADLSLDPESLTQLVGLFAHIKDDLPRSAVVHLARAFAEDRAVQDGKLHELVRRARIQVANAGNEDTQTQFKTLWKTLRGQPWDEEAADPYELATWIKLAELWDYCQNRNRQDQQGENK